MTCHVAVFSTQPYDKTSFDLALKDTSELILHYFEAALSLQTCQLAQNMDAVCIFVNDSADAQVITSLAHMGIRHIALRCAGFNQVDLEAAQLHGLSVSRVPAYSPESVAEHTLALIMTLNRKTHRAFNRVREGNFTLNGLQGFTLKDKVAGIVGTGHIGKATARILLGMGCKVLCYDPSPDSTLREEGVEYVRLNSLIQQSHIISLHCPLSPATHHLINHDVIEQMRSQVMLINTSRGGLLDTRAVIDGLKTGKIGYLGIDVYEQEAGLFFHDHSDDIIQDDLFERLASFPNTLITGHQGFFTHEALGEIAATTLDNLQRAAVGKHHPDTFMV